MGTGGPNAEARIAQMEHESGRQVDFFLRRMDLIHYLSCLERAGIKGTDTFLKKKYKNLREREHVPFWTFHNPPLVSSAFLKSTVCCSMLTNVLPKVQ